MIILELTPDEALSLRNLLDAAVRGQGIRAAEFALPLDAKILAAARLYESQHKPDAGNGKEAMP